VSGRYSVSRAVVTGAARGIGAAIAGRLAEEGLAVALLDLDEEAAHETAAAIADRTGGTTFAVGCDVSDREAVASAVDESAGSLGGLDTLVTNAGIARDGFLHKLDDDSWDDVLAVHLTGTFACLRAAAPHLRSEGPGRVVCISSVSGATGNLGQANYSAAKGGIVALVKTAARELARPQTTVNAIRPGFIDTAMTREMPDAARAALIDSIPLGRVGQPEDVAGAVAFLVSDDAAFITGATIDVNGGFYM
jgi:NAD(P)-dependent dehydrogenase (short-subunit alcohol dehydrogenase family)